MPLSTDQRNSVRDELMTFWSTNHSVITGLTKADLISAVNALDDGVNSILATVNTLLPEPAKSNLSNLQKAKLLEIVVKKNLDII